ncbi:Predicted DNA-binding transcriptional regulator YafY, contains an HTH and WYL domains [Jiangella alkaliphila]|uniref:Predicted DNA-binding transcriptional regulator YafY, contains an HTH and WYL domains n=2 Tax=Jiangella alkaliphila TaxID=419479 RepID=A0A1H2GT79_9ACTN|nr:Predicted DNA-binding transcriptional regulator YafY, contains an HTH and WYL domains [Jiangella alkaliphila]
MAMMLLIQQRRTMTAAEVADELEVSVRTVYRDIAALQASGVPLWTESGPGGGIRLVEGWRTKLDGLTGDEAAALFFGGVPSAVADLGLGTVLVAAQTKVIAMLPPELRGRAARLRERFHVDAPGWFDDGAPPEALTAVSDAVWSGRCLDVAYRRADQTVSRLLDPLGLVLKAGTWYLVAAHRQQARTYKVSRIDAATVLPEASWRPDGFDLAEWWARSSAEFDRSLLRYRCRIRLSARALRRLHLAVGAMAATRARETASAPGDDGWSEVDLWTESEDVAVYQLFTLMTGVEVLEPASLRAAVRAVAQELADRNC